jgi:hypothetical protein
MHAYVSVLSHPYFGVTGSDGTVRLADVPPGDYVVATWHETLGTREKQISLPASGRESLELAY